MPRSSAAGSTSRSIPRWSSEYSMLRAGQPGARPRRRELPGGCLGELPAGEDRPLRRSGPGRWRRRCRARGASRPGACTGRRRAPATGRRGRCPAAPVRRPAPTRRWPREPSKLRSGSGTLPALVAITRSRRGTRSSISRPSRYSASPSAVHIGGVDQVPPASQNALSWSAASRSPCPCPRCACRARAGRRASHGPAPR